MREDGIDQVAGTAVVQEKDTLAESPQRRSPELIRAGLPLDDVIGQVASHAMHQQV